MQLILENLNDTQKLATVLASELELHSEIYLLLKGNLASGKTTLTKFILKTLGIIKNVNSPSFVILNQYSNQKLKINHMDCYRLSNNENFDLYLEEFENAINIIEWPSLIFDEIKNKKIIEIQLVFLNDTVRKLLITYNFKLKSDLIKNIKKDFKIKD